MWRRTRTALAVGGISILLQAAAGCTVSVQPWTKPTGGNSGMDPAAPGFMPVGFQGPMPRSVSGSNQPMQAPNNEILVKMNKDLNEAEDQRRALQDKVANLTKQLKERDDSLQLASVEMAASSTKLKRTRDEFQQWETEIQELRERVRKLEDYRRDVGRLIDEILLHLQPPREPLRLPTLDRSLKKD